MTAQLAPDTAVRWLSELVFIAWSSDSPTALVSPTARPGRSAPPFPGSADARSTKPDRIPAAQANDHGGPSLTSTGRPAKSRTAAASPGSVSRATTLASSTLPMGTGCSSATVPNRRAGTDTPQTLSPTSSRVTVPRIRWAVPSSAAVAAASVRSQTERDRASSITDFSVTARSTVTDRPESAARTSGSGVRPPDRAATAVATRATARRVTAASAHHDDRRRGTAERTRNPATTAHTAVVTNPPTATPHPRSGIPMSTAAVSQAAAAGKTILNDAIRRSSRTSRSVRWSPACTVTPSPAP